jgi:hypothetical protein
MAGVVRDRLDLSASVLAYRTTVGSAVGAIAVP